MKKLSINALFTFVASLVTILAAAQNPVVVNPSALTAAAPNLVITNIVPEKLVYVPGETVNCKVTVKNIGSAKAVGTLDDPAKGYMVDMVLSTDASAPIAFAVVPNPYEYPRRHVGDRWSLQQHQNLGSRPGRHLPGKFPHAQSNR